MKDHEKMPVEPYPGLRPFLDFEADLLQGRESQIREIVDRLVHNKFVAVVGGSGCGKSSLIRAGVANRLRANAIPKAGGYWIPVVCTPSTTRARAGEPGDPSTPVTRLAWKFDRELAPIDDDESARDARLLRIAQVFRSGNGFSRLIRAFEDDVPDTGPSRDTAQYLFVIDQFEELFHRNNRGSPDAKTMIDAVVAHFFDPHPRCFVVITMRSEGLAACAEHVDLPEAVNKAMYLVRRLNSTEQTDAIVGPAKVFLRQRRRALGFEGAAALPRDIHFDEAVVERIKADVERLSSDPDHLPLLQHLLARLWQAARERERDAPDGIPTSIRWTDLVNAACPEPTPALKETVALLTQQRYTTLPNDDGPWPNTLRLSLENWAQRVYDGRSMAKRADIDRVLARLGYRDPDNGLYFQNRLEVDDRRLFPGVAAPIEHLESLLRRGFLDEVNYLFWDRENPRKVTLKVSHEAFIRGWLHFRKIVDGEAERYEEFVTVRRRCIDWREAGSHDKDQFLLTSPEVARLDDARLDQVLASCQDLADWFDTMARNRGEVKLEAVREELRTFIDASRAALARVEEHKRKKEYELAEAQARKEAADAQAAVEKKLGRRARVLALISAVAFVVALGALDSTRRLLNGIEAHGQARTIAEQSPRDLPLDDAAAEQLDRLLRAAKQTRLGQEALPKEGSFSLLGPLKRDNSATLVSSEAYVNGLLRQLLMTHVWRGSQPDDPKSLREVVLHPRNDCEVRTAQQVFKEHAGHMSTGPTKRGHVLAAGRSDDEPEGVGNRALFIPSAEPADDAIQRRGVVFHPVLIFESEIGSQKGRCIIGESITLGEQQHASPRFILDAFLGWIGVLNVAASPDEARAFAADGEAARPSLTLYKIDWSRSDSGYQSPLQIRILSNSQDRDSATVFKSAFAEPSEKSSAQSPDEWAGLPFRAVPSWDDDIGTGIKAGPEGDEYWFVMDGGARRIIKRDHDTPSGTPWTPLAEEQSGNPCAILKEKLDASSKGKSTESVGPPFERRMFVHEAYCIEVKTYRSVDPLGVRANRAQSELGQVFVALYHRPVGSALRELKAAKGPNEIREKQPSLVSSFEFLGEARIAPGSTVGRWFIGNKGTDVDGWIGARVSTRGAAPPKEHADGTGGARQAAGPNWAAPLSTGALVRMAAPFCKLAAAHSDQKEAAAIAPAKVVVDDKRCPGWGDPPKR